MIRILLITLLVLSLNSIKSQDQYGILENVYEDALQQSLEQQKSILFFIHSRNCYSCPDLDSLLNSYPIKDKLDQNFIMVKIDVSHPVGIRLINMYHLRSVPTILLFNNKQEHIFQIERDVSKENILEKISFLQEPTLWSKSYKEAYRKKQKMINGEEVASVYNFKIIDNYIFETKIPENLYNQSYLHNTLEDGQLYAHVAEYLSSQADWSAEKNMQFIVDLVDDTRTPAIQFLVENRKDFEEIYGQEKIDSLFSDLVNFRLYQLQPEPKFNEVKTLMSYLSPTQTDKRTYDYLIDLKFKTENYAEYLFLERKYLKKFAPKDHKRMIKICDIYLENIKEDYNTKLYIELAERAIKLNPKILGYEQTIARLYLRDKDKCNASDHGLKALFLAEESGKEIDDLHELLREINKLKLK